LKPRATIADRTARILVVDDERHNRDVLELMLEAEGFQVVSVGSASEALDTVARQPPDLILLDIMMPGMDGYGVASQVKGTFATRNIPIIMVSALDSREARMRGLGAGAEDFLTKPVDRGELCVRVRNLLRLKAYGDYYDDYSRILEAEVMSRTADLAERSERLSLATAVGRVGVWEWDLTSHTLAWDTTMFDIYGLVPMEKMPYQNWSHAVHADDLSQVEASLQLAITIQGQSASEYRIVLPDKSVRHVSAVQSVVLDANTKVRRVIGVNVDVTERKHAEQILEQSGKDQMRFKDEFLSHVSHELRSPLTAIKQFTSILLGGLAGELNAEQHHYQQIVLKNIHQLQAMIDDLLEVTRLETDKVTVRPEAISVADAVVDAFNTFQVTAQAKQIALSHTVAEDLSRAYADPIRLRQIFNILLDNALKFTPRGGAVTIDARGVSADPPRLVIEVSDTGCGIDPANARSIFERLYQVDEPSRAGRKGLGLGLHICKELVTLQGGEIFASRRLARGSTFTLTLPAACGTGLRGPHDAFEAPALVSSES
jgi:PAS domain S-box-containing protein